MTAPELDLAAVKARRQVVEATADVSMVLAMNPALRPKLMQEMAMAAARCAADVPALVDRLEQAEREVERQRGVVADVRATVEEARQASMRGEVWVVSELGFKVLATIDGDPS